MQSENMYIPQSDDYDHHEMTSDAVIEYEYIDPSDLAFDELCVYIRAHLPNTKS